MKRNAWNILIDALSLMIFMGMISTGMVLKYVLPPGSGRAEMLLEGRGRGHQSILAYMGLERHQWGEVHFYFSLAFLIFLIIHLALHWSWIRAVTFGTPQAPQPLKRKIIALSIIAFIIFAFLFPWIGKPVSYARQDYIEMKGLE